MTSAHKRLKIWCAAVLRAQHAHRTDAPLHACPTKQLHTATVPATAAAAAVAVVASAVAANLSVAKRLQKNSRKFTQTLVKYFFQLKMGEARSQS